MVTEMEVDMVADMEVDMVADMVADMVDDMVADMEMDIVANMEVDRQVFSSRMFCGPKLFQVKAFPGLRIFKLCEFFFFSAQQQQYHQKWDRRLC